MTTPNTIEQINELYRDSAIELLENYGLGAKHFEKPPENATLCSVLSVTGDCIKIVSILQPQIQLLTELYPGDGSNLTQQDIEDWCGEINNQLAGRLKNKLLDRGCEVMLGLPSLVVGKEVTATMPKDTTVESLHFGTDGGAMWAFNVVQIDPEFELMPAGAAQSAGRMGEGEISLF